MTHPFLGTDHNKKVANVQCFTRNRRQNQRQIGQRIARNRLMENVSSSNNNNGVLVHHRPGTGDVYMSGESNQYSNCSFLDGHDLLLAASIHGDVDVIRLPRYSHTSSGNKTMTEVAGKVRLSDSNTSSYSVSARYKLKPLQNGQAFAVGTPSGTLSIFSTEHASTWGRERLPFDWKRRGVQQDSLPRNLQAPSNMPYQQQRSWAPFIACHWQTNLLERQCFAVGSSSLSSYEFLPMSPGVHVVEPAPSVLAPAPQEWSIKPHSDSLWDFRETPSSLLAAHAKQEFSGRARTVGVLDSRLNGTVAVIHLSGGKKKNAGRRRYKEPTTLPEGITALCFASEYTLLTAHARLSPARVQNSLHVWDLRKSDLAVRTMPLTNPSIGGGAGMDAFRRHFVSFLTPSASTGKVMITSSSHQNRSIVQHFWYDLVDINQGQQEHPQIPKDQRSSPGVEPCIHQRNRNTNVFATNPNQDFMACYENSSGPDSIRLFDPNDAPSDDDKKTSNHRRPQNATVTSRKRSLHERKTSFANLSSNKMRRPSTRVEEEDSSDSSSSSSSDEDDDDQSDKDEDDIIIGDLDRGVKRLGRFRPKLSDHCGLTTHLSCLSVNDTGTAIAGGSLDGDIFVWRGA